MLTRDTSKMGAPDGADLHVAALRWWAHACRLSQQGMLHGTPLGNIQGVPGKLSWRSLHWLRTVCVGMWGAGETLSPGWEVLARSHGQASA